MTVIELGNPGSATAAPVRRRLDRRVPAVVVALLCLATLGGSAVPLPAVIQPAWSIPFAATSVVRVGRRAVFVRSVDGGPRVTAYRLRDGAVQWSKPVAAAPGGMILQEPGGLLMPVGPAAASVALDLGTGAELWRLPGDVVHATSGTVLVSGPDRVLRQARMADGAVIWSRPVAGAASWTPEEIVVAGAGGRIETLRSGDGAVLASGRLPNGPGIPVRGGIGADSGLLLVNRMETDRAAVTGYDLGTLKPRWHFAQTASDDVVTGPAAYACGVVLCFIDGTATVGLDRVAGTVRWRAGGWIDAEPTIAADRLMAESPDHAWHVLIDSVSGRIVGDLGVGTAVWDGDRMLPRFYLRPLGRRVSVSRINVRSGGLQTRGMVAAAGSAGCTAGGDTLVCGTTDGRLTATVVG